MTVLHKPVLVLNRNWQAVRCATVARALVMLWNEAAKVVDPTDYSLYTWADWSSLRPKDGEPVIRTHKLRLRVPEVITLNNYDKLPSAVVTFSRRNIFKRDHYTCMYCGVQPGPENLTIDHVIPRSSPDGLGKSTWENCVLACVPCNKKKGSRTLVEAGMKLRKKPAKPQWKPIYATHGIRVSSWEKFISDAYWMVDISERDETQGGLG